MNQDTHAPQHLRTLPPSSKEIEAVLAEAKMQPDTIDAVDAISILYRIGMRAGELRELRWEDVDFDRRIITIVGGKTGRVRTIPLTDKVIEILRARLDRQPDSVFVMGASPRVTLARAARQVRILSERVLGRALHLHSLRHAFAARLMAAGGDVSALLYVMGYSSVRTTFETFRSRDQLSESAAKQLIALES